MNNLKISTRLALLIGALVLMLISIGALGLFGIASTEARLQSVYDDRLLPSNQLGEIKSLYMSSRLAINAALLDASPDHVKANLDVVRGNRVVIDKTWADYMATKLTDDEARLAKAYAAADQQYVEQALRPAIEALQARNMEQLGTILNDKIRPLFKPVAEDLDSLLKIQLVAAEEELNASKTAYAQFRLAAILCTLGALSAAVAYGLWLVRSITVQLGAEPAELSVAVQRVADGDLATPVALRAGDTQSTMASVARMHESLSRIVSSVRGNSESVATASAQIAQGNQDLSSRTEEQASALQQTAASMEQLGTAVTQNADNALQANQLAKGASEVAAKGGEVVSQVVNTMKDINDSSKRIADIIGVIDGIAFQTNILALNAAVEAARAGEQGRGFAVVASEVRSLAQRSADAAKEIKTLITASVERVTHGTVLVDQAGATMTEVVAAIKRVTDIVGEISAASIEQSAGVKQVGEAVGQMDQATQQNAALVEESAAAAESLRTQAQDLVTAVAVFRLSGTAAVAPVARSGDERLSPSRPANVVRPDFSSKAAKPTSVTKPGIQGATPRAKPSVKPKVKPDYAPRIEAAAPQRNGTTDTWESF